MSTNQSPYAGKSKIERRVKTPAQKRTDKDLFYNKNTEAVWDDVQSLADNHQKAKEGAAEILTYVCEAVQQPGFIPHIKDPAKLTKSINGVTKQFDQYAKDFEEIKSSHIGKKGYAKDANEHAQAMDVGMKYFTLTNHYDKVVHPLIVDITQQVNRAEKSYEKCASTNSTPKA